MHNVYKMTSQLSNQEVTEMLDVLNTTFGVWGDNRLFQWKYFENPFGDSLHVLGYEGDQAVACVSFWRNDVDELRAYQCVDLAVLPSHRRRGFFREAVTSCLGHLEGAYFYTVPGVGGNSRPGFLEFGWEVKRRYRVSAQLTQLVLRQHENSPPIADEYAQWRFASHPSKRYYVCRMNGRPYLVSHPRKYLYVAAGALSSDLGMPEVSPWFLLSYDHLHPLFMLPGKGGYVLENPCYVSHDGYIPTHHADTF